jgi:hypothetical protein
MRGSEEDLRFMLRLFGMIAVVMAAIIGSLYLHGRGATAALHLVMLAGGIWLCSNYLRLTDRNG